jgi:hypothetical protein
MVVVLAESDVEFSSAVCKSCKLLMSISLSDAFEPYSIDSELNSNLELSKLADIISSFSTIKFELSVFVTLLISAALMLPIKKKNINTTETNNAVFLIEIFTPSWFSL